MIFSNRLQAGQLLSEKLLKFKGEDVLVLALPRGGVPVAAEIASKLEVPLDVLIVRKIGAPFHSELAVGALCEGEEPVWNYELLKKLDLELEDLSGAVKNESQRIKTQIESFRKGQSLPIITNKSVVVVDDGLATGATALAAIEHLKKMGARKIILAVPVAALSTANKLRSQISEVIVFEERMDLNSVGQWYHDFTQVSDEEVVSLLHRDLKKKVQKVNLQNLSIPILQNRLEAELVTFTNMKALIIFVHGSGSSRKSPRNKQVATDLNESGFGTLLFDLFTEEEALNRKNVFDIDFLSQRLVAVTEWLQKKSEFEKLPLGYFGASTGAGAAIQAAARQPNNKAIYAIVSRGGRPDLAGPDLALVRIPTLLLVGGQDFEVIDLNRHAKKSLIHSEVSIIPGATHLFEESGALEEVSRQAAQWFTDCLRQEKTNSLSENRASLDEAIEKSIIPIRHKDDLDRLIEKVKNCRVVMLGESSHGTSEFYQLRALLSHRLIKEQGFNFIAVEGDWPDAYRLNKFIRYHEGGSARGVLKQNHRWPIWMWANEEIVKLAEWMRSERAGFYGLDIYSLFESIDEVVKYLKKKQPMLTDEVERRYACFDPFKGDEISYARSLLQLTSGCKQEVIKNLQQILKLRVEATATDGEDLFSAQQNARVITNAESYYRAMLNADASSWNIRDTHMMETLERLLERSGPESKAIIWAHNSHIGDYRATDMSEEGYVNLGGLARLRYGEEKVALVGFGTYQGEVLASSAWGGLEKIMRLPPARKDSYEFHLHQAAKKFDLNQFYLMLERTSLWAQKKPSPFAQRLGHRAVGVVYNPQGERGNYVPTELSNRYDAFIFIDETHALKSLHSAFERGFVRGEFPETWPSGV